jgi:DNA mismatch endonuclease (patch repair protein)
MRSKSNAYDEGPKDRVDPARSAQMALVRSKGTKPELVVRKIVDVLRVIYQINSKEIRGSPDLSFVRRKKAIFVHGCFWHQHQNSTCWRSRIPKSRQEFWLPKLEANQVRDRKQIRELRKSGWQVLVVWECQTIKSKQAALTRRIQHFLTS